MSKVLSLSLILPVFNERQNLEYLVPQLYSILENKCQKFEILVIDDNSTDDTNELMNLFTKKYPFVSHTVRVEERSLPISIHDGIEKSQFSNVMWLDADGSMDADSVEVLISKYSEDDSKYLIGSRFVEGGAIKVRLPVLII